MMFIPKFRNMLIYKFLVLCLTFLISGAEESNDGYCIVQEREETRVPKVIRYNDVVTFVARCPGYYFKKCLQERTVEKSRITYNLVESWVSVRKCCEGYVKIGDKCLPICEHECYLGSCTAPNTCTCYDGYTKETPNKCKPHCDGCLHGDCLTPNMCQCNSGYDWDGTAVECVPGCSTSCANGKCTAPEYCTCDDGFVRHQSQNLCIPECVDHCAFGKCVEPNKCECDFGYIFKNGSHNECEPLCEFSCKNAKCVEPNVCECHDGYSVHDETKPHECHCGKYCVEIDGKCHCLDENQRVSGSRLHENSTTICMESNCINGFCASPDNCECNEGFAKDDDNSMCISINETCIDESVENCNGSAPSRSTIFCECINGVCSTNNTCFCIGGYRMSNERNNKCVPYCSKECENGYCIDPDICECHSGYRIGYNETDWNICYPVCDPDVEENNGCINGTCIAPDICECFDGFELSRDTNFTCIPSQYDDAKYIHSTVRNWLMATSIILVLILSILAFGSYYFYKRRELKYRCKNYEDDYSTEPISCELSEDL